jgi:hypothetical protein
VSDPHGPYGSGVLHLPTDLVIDPVTVDRLARQLAGAPDDVIGVVAPLADLPPGASTRTHAEWCSLLPLDAATDAKVPGGAPSIRGAVLLRAGLESSTGPGTLPAGVLRTDPGAVVHRAEVEPAADVDAASEGRSPFPRRPVVLFLALAGDPLPPDRLQEIERLLDGLLEAEVEPRLAGGGAEVRTRRHRPCAASAATVATLAPDVVVALDAAALTQAPAWCTRRGTVLVDMTGPPSDGDVELVSWQIDRHPTRLRARVSPSVDAAALARLVNRLAAGPQPQPPSDRATDGSVPVSIDSSDSSDLIDPAGPDHPRPRTVVLVEPVGPPGPLLTGLIDRLARSGHEVTHQRDPSVVAVLEHGDDPDQLADLGPRGGAVAADPEVVDRLRARGVRAQRVPVMTPVARQRELRAASGAPVASSGGAIGWTRLGRTGPDDPIVAAVTATLLALLGARPDLEVEIVADAGAVPDPLTDHPQVRRVVGRPDPGEQARWSAHVLTPGDDGPPIEIALVEAAHAGVPTLLPVATARAVGGLADPLLVVDEPATPDAWAGPLQLLLAGDDRPARSVWALAAADALEQDAATDLVVARLLGWLDRGATR